MEKTQYPSSTTSPASTTREWSAPESAKLGDRIAGAIRAVIAGADNLGDIETCGNAKREAEQGRAVAIDGKTVRCSADKANGESPIQWRARGLPPTASRLGWADVVAAFRIRRANAVRHYGA